MMKELIDLMNRRPAMNAGLVQEYAAWNAECYGVMEALSKTLANEDLAQEAADMPAGQKPRTPGSFVNAAGIHASDKPATVVRKLDAAFHDAVTFADTPAQAQGCTRSHPHENMSPMCVLRTEIARLNHAAAVAEAKGDERTDALQDSAYAAGMLSGWNLCVADDHATFSKVRGERMTGAARVANAARAAAPAQAQEDATLRPRLTVRLTSFPESNGKRNWTALLVRTEKWDGLIGNCGGISIARGELWNRVAYHAEEARFLIGERDTEPFILDYGDDIATPAEWKGEERGPARATKGGA